MSAFPAEEEPRRWYHIALAVVLGGSLLAMTYVLFDPDLGTPVPLFQEFTCRGDLVVQAGNGYGDPWLRVPETGVRALAFAPDGSTPRPAFFTVWKRDLGGDWTWYFDHTAPTGEHSFFMSGVAEGTDAYVTAKDLEGKHCQGESRVLRANLTSSAQP